MNPFLSSEVRSLFPGARDKVYFNIAETCLIPQSTADVAHAYVEASLAGRGDKAAAARVPGLDRKTLYRKLTQHRDALLGRLSRQR